MKRLAWLALFIPGVAISAPFVISDPLDSRVTHCGFTLNGIVFAGGIPVASVAGGNICKIDIGSLAAGLYTITATARIHDAAGTLVQESANSLPLQFEKCADGTAVAGACAPAPLPAPTGLNLAP